MHNDMIKPKFVSNLVDVAGGNMVVGVADADMVVSIGTAIGWHLVCTSRYNGVWIHSRLSRFSLHRGFQYESSVME